MRISTGSEDGWRTIRISDAGPGERAALAELGFPPDLVQRYPPGTRYFDRAVANLRQAAGEMAAPEARRLVRAVPRSAQPRRAGASPARGGRQRRAGDPGESTSVPATST